MFGYGSRYDIRRDASACARAMVSSTVFTNESSDDGIFVERSHEGELVPKEDSNSVTFSMIKGYYLAMSDTSDWSDEADGVLCFTKTKDWNWSMISNILQRSEEDAKERFKYLTSLAKEDGGIPTDILGELYFLKMRRYPALLENLAAKSDEFEKAKAKLDERFVIGGRTRSKVLAQSSLGQKHWLSSLSPNGDAAEGLNKYLDGLSGARTSAPSISPPSPDTMKRASQVLRTYRKKAADNFTRRIHPKYPLIASFVREHSDLRKLSPDEFFDGWDCVVLATLEARYRGNKWLNLAADFANATGRSVDADVLKAKLEDAPLMGKAESAEFYGFEPAEMEDDVDVDDDDDEEAEESSS